MEASTRRDDPRRSPVPSAEATLGVAQALAVAATGVRIVAPGPLWIQGEVEGFVQSRAGHWYWSLTGDGARLSVCCLGRDATAVAATLAQAQVKLGDGLTVRVHGSLGVYSPRGQVQLRVFAIDPAVSVGAAVLARRQVRARLAAAGLLELQRALRPVHCPLRVGVVAPAGQGLEDFMRVLERTPWAWQLRVLTVATEGPAAPAEIARAVEALGRADVVVVTRGGGAGVTAAYDSLEVATAICSCPVPVVMAVGHSSDASLADDCAWRAVSTPTAAGELCAQLVERADQALSDLGRELVVRSRASLERAERDLAGAEAAQRSSRNARLAVLVAVALAVVIVLLVLLR
jgi:exodeoxyribonuclease VII large subunit